MLHYGNQLSQKCIEPEILRHRQLQHELRALSFDDSHPPL
jgi:hypothetical protein